MAADNERAAPAPARPIRRFDVFAEVKRLQALAEGRPEDEAKGHGIWLAKVVAPRRFGRQGDGAADRHRVRQEDAPREADGAGDRFRSVGDEVQTDETFEREIVERMGREFYERVFAAAVGEAVGRGEKYEQFRDTIRAEWRPTRR
ncbi:MAG: hypothetical protein M3Q10_09535 [Chloroflexota bacterium]|nr:hypothetical protein [Chloroflexota bacterium]